MASGGKSSGPAGLDNETLAKAAGVIIAGGIAWSLARTGKSKKSVEDVVEDVVDAADSAIRKTQESIKDAVEDAAEQFKETVAQIEDKLDQKEAQVEKAVSGFIGKAKNFGGGKGAAAAGSSKGKNVESGKKTKNHNISGGETLYGLSRKYNVGIEELRKANGIKGDVIVTGSSLKIPC